MLAKVYSSAVFGVDGEVTHAPRHERGTDRPRLQAGEDGGGQGLFVRFSGSANG